jgi:hypothetical protein
MGHRATVYTVKVKEAYSRKDDAFVPLGDMDGRGTYLGDVIYDALSDTDFSSSAKDTLLRTRVVEQDGDEVRAIMLHGQSGVVADILDADGNLKATQELDDLNRMSCGVLFDLPKKDVTGYLVCHVNGNRSAIRLLEGALKTRIRNDFNEKGHKRSIVITPFTRRDELEAAIARGRLDKIRLVKYEHPHHREVASTKRWVPSNEIGVLEVQFSAGERIKERLKATPVQRFLHGKLARSEIVEFAGYQFDEIKAVIETDDGHEKTINIEEPEVGHRYSKTLTGFTVDARGEPRAESLYKKLADVLADVK